MMKRHFIYNLKHDLGFGLAEILISLFLVSLILATLSQVYLGAKAQYKHIEKVLETHFDLQWVYDLLADSLRHAGFTPCLGLDHLIAMDRRTEHAITSLRLSPGHIQVSSMSERFSRVLERPNPRTLRIAKSSNLNEKHPLLIADCIHAEVQEILSLSYTKREIFIKLTKPLMFNYEGEIYVGEYLEEDWLIKKNPRLQSALYYRSGELSPLIHTLQTKRLEGGLLELDLGLDEGRVHHLVLGLRNS